MEVTMNRPLGFGDKLGLMAMLVWLTVAVGPWWELRLLTSRKEQKHEAPYYYPS